jgi:hypothetical protein
MEMNNMPKVLFHASSNTNIEVLEPRAITIRNKDEGAVVFATDDKAYSSMFIVPSDDSWTKKSGYQFGNDPKLWITIIADEIRYRESDKGGAIYTLPIDTFINDTDKKGSEWISRIPVKPIKKEVFSNGLDAMIENGVIVYFVSETKFKEFGSGPHNPKERFKLLSQLQSENEKRGFLNPILSRID